jgi:uncharacterized protein involved in type VI secretion and phage assembly
VGKEVIVQFLDGDIDRPIQAGVVHNRFNMPQWNEKGSGIGYQGCGESAVSLNAEHA